MAFDMAGGTVIVRGPCPPGAHDPYDLWMTRVGVGVKDRFYRGRLSGKVGAVAIGLADWLTPEWSRSLLHAPKRQFPITAAQWILSQDSIEDPGGALAHLRSLASSRQDLYGLSWGLGFPWMSKNGLYDEDTPFVTHAPYCLEALLYLASISDAGVAAEALADFRRTRPFFDALKIMFEDDGRLALSYAPIDEPRIVVNANAYAAYSYAMFTAVDGDADAHDRVERLLRWVLAEQCEDGSWYYYADRDQGNFIDGFHSCFVLKNLIKTARCLPEFSGMIDEAVVRGVAFLERSFLDPESGLLKRFVERDIKDPFHWDLYDQAEYLGLLNLLGRVSDAERFAAHVRSRFER
ncbi:MAG: hypothetical protein GC138_00755, partial [Gammaproteobacteria bacterium]|nr:hypothetical protein [Gammaproteobacteria bacterium]